MLSDPTQLAKVAKIKVVADEIGVSLTHLALAWCVKNPHVSTVITGASNVAQVRDNMAALDVVDALTDDVMARLDEITRS
jgi:aryl-alcohol dehydrogenase-like predicted oxidoreductase